MSAAKGPRIEVREYKTRKTVRTIPLKSADPIRAEKVLSGLLRQLDTDRYYAVEKGLAGLKAVTKLITPALAKELLARPKAAPKAKRKRTRPESC